MINFSDWILPKIQEIGGFSVLCDRIPDTSLETLLAWTCGAKVPSYKSQIKLVEALGCDLADFRSALGQPCTPFAEWLIRKILAHGKSADFPRETGIEETTYQKWLARGNLPKFASYRKIVVALIKWGDPNPREVLMAELLMAIEKSLAAREGAFIDLTPEISKDCNSNRVAS
ncbi:MAG: hypothetical protein ACRC62_07160 [Microcoleus sp.]